MFRSMTSVVSALSNGVANGHQIMHTFPLLPLKFRTVGFPQYGFKRVVSRDLRGMPLIRDHSLDLLRARFISVVGLASKRHTRPLTQRTPSSGPWLRCRLYCPSASSLTMATSELLNPSPRLLDYSRGALRTSARFRRSPIYSAEPLSRAAVPTPMVPATALGSIFIAGLAFAHFVEARQPQSSAHRTKRGSIHDAATFTLWYGPDSC